jgi:geranylgeranyl reductase family protein
LNQTYDVVVVGAGPGGSVLSADLAGSGRSVLLLDKFQFPRDKTCGDALSPSAVRILRRFGQIEDIWSKGRRINGLRVSTPSGLAIDAPLSSTSDDGLPGYVVKRFDLDDQLRQLAVRSGAEFVDRVRVSEVDQHASDVVSVAGIREGRRIEVGGRVVVLAVGANLGLLIRLGLVGRDPDLSFAVRQYWTGARELDHRIQLRFDGVPQPGYGWIFPLSNTTANVGVGVFGQTKASGIGLPAMLDAFLRHPPIEETLSPGKPDGPLKGFPLRTDFHRSIVQRQRVLLIGEAAGLVNPFTGEGIDYAMESALIASQTIQGCFAGSDLSVRALGRYEQRLRARFQRIFVWTSLMRRVYMNPRVLDALGRACLRWPDVTRLFIDVLLTREDPLRAFSPGVVLKVLRSLPAAG